MPSPAPVAHHQRIDALDVLRGLAVLGILVMNITGFGLPLDAVWDPGVLGENSWLDLGAWFLGDVGFDGKMRALFSMLFGAGVVLTTRRIEARVGPGQAARPHYRRMFWLLVFGLVHSRLLLWPGDILYSYAVFGLFVYPLRHASPRRLLLAGIVLLGIGSLRTISSMEGDHETWRQAAVARAALERGEEPTEEWASALEAERELITERRPDEEALAAKIDNRRGGWAGISADMQEDFWTAQTSDVYGWEVFDQFAMMLVGMALLKLGVLSAARSTSFYLILMSCGLGCGWSLAGYTAWTWMRTDFALVVPELEVLWAAQHHTSRLLIALGYASVVMLVCRSGRLAGPRRVLACAGRLALTNYVGQTVLCTLLFHGYGLGLFGAFGRGELLGVVLAIWVVQLVFSWLWLRSFLYGPLEWCWRALTYGRRPAMRRRANATPGINEERQPSPVP